METEDPRKYTSKSKYFLEKKVYPAVRAWSKGLGSSVKGRARLGRGWDWPSFGRFPHSRKAPERAPSFRIC